MSLKEYNAQLDEEVIAAHKTIIEVFEAPERWQAVS
jgi:hypothetical protein